MSARLNSQGRWLPTPAAREGGRKESRTRRPVSMRNFFANPFRDSLGALEKAMTSARPGRAMALMVLGLIVTWFLYVPVHELLHALGCWAAGGVVTELQIDPKYGGGILKRWFPFVVPGGGPYAGRLTGFDTHGSDLVYLATDFMPFALSLFPGVSLLLLCRRRSRPLLLGASVVLGLAPFYSATGDYYEMGSIVVTGVWTCLVGTDGGTVGYEFVRSDDVFQLLGELIAKRAELRLTSAGRVLVTVGLCVLSMSLSILLAFATYAAGRVVAVRVVGSGRAAADSG